MYDLQSYTSSPPKKGLSMKSTFVRFLSISILALLATLPAHASAPSSSFTCESTQSPTFTATATLDDQGVLEQLTIDMEGEVQELYSPAVKSEFDVIAHFAKDADVQKYGLLTELLRLAKPTVAPSYFIVHSLTSPGKGMNLDEIMEYLMDDLSGTLILEARDQAHNVLGRSMIVGWGGYFANCR